MRRSVIAFVFALFVGGIFIWAYVDAEQRSASTVTIAEMQEIVVNSRSENPKSGLASDWFECREQHQPSEDLAATKFLCKTWTVQGVTSALFALKFGEDWVPVVESRLEGAPEAGPLVVDVTGGPGGMPFHADPAMTEAFVQKLRKNDFLELFRGAIATDRPEYQLMQRGFTIASVGYWGMNMRTFNEPDEIELAVRDVRLALDYYRDQLGEDPPLITTSLGNHLVLGAIGQDRLENANTLALVPVMDGLQKHVERFKTEMAASEAENGPSEGVKFFNIYSRSSDGVEFDHSRALFMGDFASQFFGDSDYHWRDISLTASCSKIVLGTKDPRTKAYLAASDDLPSFIEVWESDHDIIEDAPERTRTAYADYADCLLSQSIR